MKDSFFAAIRAELSERAWDQAVRLARAGSVDIRKRSADEIVARVGGGNRPVPVEVHLWPGDEDYDCECGGAPCIHVGAAAIVARQAPQGAAPARTRLRYALKRSPEGLVVSREIAGPNGVVPLTGPLREAKGVVIGAEDLEADDVLKLGDRKLPATGWARLLRAFADAELTLDGQPLKVSLEPILPVVRVEDEGPGFKLSLRRDKRVEEGFPGGLCRTADTLHPTGDGGLPAQKMDALRRGMVYGPEQVGELVSAVLPMLRRHLPVRVVTTRLPEGQATPPRLRLSLSGGDRLRVRLDLCYGERWIEDGKVADGPGPLPIRDPAAEAKLRQGAEALRLPVGRDVEMDEDEALRFVRGPLGGFGGEISGDVGRFRVRKEPVRVGFEEGRLRSEADLGKLLDAFREGRSLVPLLGGGFAPLPRDLLERHGELLVDLAGAARPDGSLPTHALAAAAELAKALDQPPPSGFEALRPLLEGFAGIPAQAPPAGLVAELRPYQMEGVQWVRWLWSAGLSGILADDMGLGKTLQALAAVAGAGGRTLVIAPTSVVGNWAAEVRKFLPGSSVCVYTGPNRKLSPADITVSSYALLRLDEKLVETEWDTVILDEAQAIKNPESQTSQAAFRLRAPRRLAMTGTPVENRLEELWSELHFCMPGFLGGRSAFEQRRARPIAAGDRAAAEALRRRVRPFILRRRKVDVARDLPPRTEIVLKCELPPAQRAVYDAVAAAARKEVAEAAGIRALQVLELLLRLRQAACHPRLLPGDRPDVSGKLDTFVEQLEEAVAEGHKCLVFSQWTSHLDLVQSRLERDLGLSCLRLDGATRDRDAVVRRFQAEDGPPVFLLSLKAGGTGLNLTAADVVFHLDPWWNPAAEDQATDRAHRIGQDKPVLAVKLVAEGTVEERILELQAAKRALAASVVSEEALVGALSREELLSLLA